MCSFLEDREPSLFDEIEIIFDELSDTDKDNGERIPILGGNTEGHHP